MTLYDSLDETAQKRIDLAEEAYLNYNNDLPETDGESPKSLVDFMTDYGNIPPEFIEAIAAAELSMTEVQQIETELNKLSPEKAKDVFAKFVDIEKRIDYDKVVELVSMSGEYTLKHEVGLVIGLRKFIASGQDISFRWLRRIENTAEEFVGKWKQEEIVIDKGDDTVIAEPDVNISDTVDLIKRRIKEANEILDKYKISSMFNNPSQEVLSSICHWEDNGKNKDEDPTLDVLWRYDSFELNNGFSLAIDHYVVKRFSELSTLDYDFPTNSQEYMDFVDRAREMGPVIDAINNLEIIGDLSTLPFTFSEAELKLFLHDNIPPLALRQIKRIEFREFSPEEDRGRTLLGKQVHSKDLGGSIITLSNTRIREDFDRQKKRYNKNEMEATGQFAAEVTKAEMLQTITHEFAHILHAELPLSTLGQWDDARSIDSINITDYVKYMNDKDYYHRHMEDFADSMTLFINRPEVLQIISPARFDGMATIFDKFSPNYKDIIEKRILKRIANDKIVRSSLGMSNSKVKEYYLAHEISTTN